MDIHAPEWQFPPNRRQYDELIKRITKVEVGLSNLETFLIEQQSGEPDRDRLRLLQIIGRDIAHIQIDLHGGA